MRDLIFVRGSPCELREPPCKNEKQIGLHRESQSIHGGTQRCCMNIWIIRFLIKKQVLPQAFPSKK